MKKSQRLAAVLLILLMLCGCSMPATPNTVVLPQTPAENHTESAPASAEPAQTPPETNAFHLEYEQTALPEPLSSVTALAMLEETLLLGGVSETGLALVRLTPEGRSEELPLPGSTEYLYALCPDGAGGPGCSAEVCRRAISTRLAISGFFRRNRRVSLRWRTMMLRLPCRRSYFCRHCTLTAFSSCAALTEASA